jgi:hypothetical protein
MPGPKLYQFRPSIGTLFVKQQTDVHKLAATLGVEPYNGRDGEWRQTV